MQKIRKIQCRNLILFKQKPSTRFYNNNYEHNNNDDYDDNNNNNNNISSKTVKHNIGCKSQINNKQWI